MLKRSSSGDNSPSTTKKPKLTSHWALGLEASIKDPNSLVESDDLVHVIKDKYPKATFHYLIIPKEPISNLRALNSSHVDLLQHMESVGEKLARKDQHQGFEFNLGYHAEPSMSRLHLHVISDDMISDCLKTKKHWNSFTTQFFMPSKEIVENLKKNDKVILPPKQTLKNWMDSPLICHKCTFKSKNIPELKKHISKHQKQL